MGGAHGAKQRAMERNRYRPKPKAERPTRVVPGAGQQTFKKAGDVIIDAQGMKHEVRSDTWH